MISSLRKKIMPVLLALALVISLLPAVTPAARALDESASLSGEGTDASPFLISSAADLAYMRTQANASGGTITPAGGGTVAAQTAYYKLTADIDLNEGVTFTFDADTGLVKVTKGENSYWLGTGIKGDSTSGTNDTFDSTASTAAAIYLSNTSTDTGTAPFEIYPWTPIGPVAHSFTGTFDGNNKTVSGIYINSSGSTFQGLFGYTKGTVKNVGVKNSIIIGSSCVGGVAGRSDGTVTGCSNMGTVVGRSSVGGVAGETSNGTISYSYNAGAVIGSVGCIGGVTGKNTGGTVQCCYNMGAVKNTGTSTGVGGVVAINGVYNNSTAGTITNCYNAGAVTSSSDRVGGVVGDNNSNCTVSYCYNTGAVKNTSSLDVGGVEGHYADSTDSVSNCYYDDQMCMFKGFGYTNTDLADHAEGASTSAMTTTAALTGWDSIADATGTNTWILTSGLYPRLTGYVDAETDYTMDETDAAYASASPLTLSYTDLTTYDTVNAVKNNITLSTANSVSWASSDTSIIANDGTVKAIGSVTMTASKGDASKTVALNVTAVPTAVLTADYTITNYNSTSGEYLVNSGAATYNTLNAALKNCTTDTNEDGKIIIQLGSAETPLEVPQVLANETNVDNEDPSVEHYYTDSDLVSATYTGSVTITKVATVSFTDKNVDSSDDCCSFGLRVPSDVTAVFKGLTATAEETSNGTNGSLGSFGVVYAVGSLTITTGTSITVTHDDQSCVSVMGTYTIDPTTRKITPATYAAFTMDGGSLTSGDDGVYFCIANARISGGTITSQGYYAVYSSGYADVTISGGTISGNEDGICVSGGCVTISGSADIKSATGWEDQYSNGDTVMLYKSALDSSATIFGKTVHASENAEIVINGVNNANSTSEKNREIKSGNYTSAVVHAEELTSGYEFEKWTSDAKLENEISTVNDNTNTIAHLTTGGNSDIYLKLVQPVPTAIPTAVTGDGFTDTAGGKGKVAGDIKWVAASPTGGITGYKIYWGSSETAQLDENAYIDAQDGADSTSYSLAATNLPTDAKYFLIHSYNGAGDSVGCLAVPITDVIKPDYIVTNGTGANEGKYIVGIVDTEDTSTHSTLTEALAACKTGGDKNSDGELVIQLGTDSASPLVIPQVNTGDTDSSSNKLVSATYKGYVSITKDAAITDWESYGLYVPEEITARLSGLNIAKNSDIDVAYRPLYAVYDWGALYVETGTDIETTKTQFCVGINSSAEFYMTGGTLNHDAEGSGGCVYFDVSSTDSEISGGTISAGGVNSYAVNLLNGNLTISGTAAISDSSTNSSGGSGMMAIGVSGGALAIKGGTISSSSVESIITAGGGTVNMTGGKLENTNSGASLIYGISNTNADVTISGGEISCTNGNTGNDSGAIGIRQNSDDHTVTVSGTAQINVNAHSGYGIFSNSSRTEGNGAVAISGGTIKISAVSNTAGVYNNGKGTINISGGSIESNCFAVQNDFYDDGNLGTVKISGGTVKATGSSACIDNKKGAVEISEANAGTPTRIISASSTNTICIHKDTSNPAVKIFGKTFHASGTAGINITGADNTDSKPEINKDSCASAKVKSCSIESPVEFKAWTSDKALTTSIGATDDVTISSLTTGDNSSVTDIYIKATAPIPDNPPTGGSFTDGDSDADQISGSIGWVAASSAVEFTGYRIYWGSDATTKLTGNTEAVYTVSGSTSTSQVVNADTALPAGAKYFLIYSNNSGGDSDKCLAVRIIDDPYSYSGGSGTAADPYQISSADDLEVFASLVNNGTDYSSTYFKQTANINLNEGVTFTFDADTGLVKVTDGTHTGYLGTGIKGTKSNTVTASTAGTWYMDTALTEGDYGGTLNTWTPISSLSTHFNGTYDGGDKTVSGVYINGSSSFQGLFGYIDSTVKNVGVANSYIKGGQYVGSVVGQNDMHSALQYCCSTGSSVIGSSDVGGVVGRNIGTVEYCCNTGIVSGGSNVGGVVGNISYSAGTVQYCYNAGAVTGSSNVGGVVGKNSGTVQYCYYDNEKCSATDSNATGKATADMQGTKLKGISGNGWTTDYWTFKDGAYPKPGKTEEEKQQPVSGGGGSSDGDSAPEKTITVTETSSELFKDSEGEIKVEANMNNAFSNSIEVKVTDTEEDASNFGLGAGNKVYPFDISLYIKGTDTKTEPEDGYAVTVSLPVPDTLLNVKDQLSIMHKSDSGSVTTLASQLKEINGVWYLVFKADEFSPYALVVSDKEAAYDETAGLPYYVSNGKDIFIGFAAGGKYIAPAGVTVLVKQNAKSFTDIGSHWAKSYIGFVTERELFAGIGDNKFGPDTGMTRAMFATVIGRLYERSYGEIEASEAHSFTDCDYSDYYGKYADWAAKEGIIAGCGNGEFRPGDPINREQMAAILYRFAGFLGVLPDDTDSALTYPDAGSVSSWAQNAALYCQSTGIITGRDGGSFVPQGTATRAEVAVILERFIESILD